LRLRRRRRCEVVDVSEANLCLRDDVRVAVVRQVGVQVVLDEKREFRFSLDEMARRITPKTKMIVINTPQNPTGGVLTLDDLKGVAKLARQHDLLILSDEIYSEIYYGTPTAGMLDIPDIGDRLLLVNGFSKTYAMTGWRVGYSVVPKDLVPTVNLFMNNSVSSTSTFCQLAAIEAFSAETAPIVANMVQEFRKRRDVFVDGLNAIPGIRCLKPHGAFYLFPNVSSFGRTSKEIARIVGVKPTSIDTYRSRIMAKLGVEDLCALVRFAIRHGLLQA